MGLPETCAAAFQFLTALVLVRVAWFLRTLGFVIISVVRPMVHWSVCARKPKARAVAERTSGTTKGSLCRVTLSGAFGLACMRYDLKNNNEIRVSEKDIK